MQWCMGLPPQGLNNDMGLLHEMKYYMLLYKALQMPHLSLVLIVPSQEKLYIL